jgi:YgiT-type zinc finger domain-containing protein
LENKEGVIRVFEMCPICGGKIAEKEVEKVLKGGTNTAIMKLTAEVCLHCGERLYTPETVSRFEGVRKNSLRKMLANLNLLGKHSMWLK